MRLHSKSGRAFAQPDVFYYYDLRVFLRRGSSDPSHKESDCLLNRFDGQALVCVVCAAQLLNRYIKGGIAVDIFTHGFIIAGIGAAHYKVGRDKAVGVLLLAYFLHNPEGS